MSKITIVEGNSNDKDQVRAYLVKGEKGDPGDLSGADIVDNLTSTDNTKVLSAKQGKVLKDLIDDNTSDLQEQINDILDEVEFIFPKFWANVSSGDCNLIKYKNKSILIDCYSTLAWTSVKAMLDDNEVSHIDYFICTHYHADHIGNFQNLITNGYINPSTHLYMPAETTTFNFDSDIQTYKNICTANGLTYYVPSENETVTINGDLKLTFTNCDGATLDTYYTDKDQNNTSTIVLVEHNDVKALYTGDAHSVVLKRIYDLNFVDSTVDLYKIGHHGIDRNAYYPFLINIKPKYAVQTGGINHFSMGEFGINGDVDLLYNLGTDIFPTFMQNDYVKFTSNGKVMQNISGVCGSYAMASQTNNIYVDITATNNAIQDGSQEHPFHELMQAVGQANSFKGVLTIIHLADGTYGVSLSTQELTSEKNRITIHKHCNLIITGNSSNNENVVLNGVNLNDCNVRFENLTIDNKNHDGIYSRNSNVELDNCIITNTDEELSTHNGIFSRNSSFYINNCEFDYCNPPIYGSYGSQITLLNVTIGSNNNGYITNSKCFIYENNITFTSTKTLKQYTQKLKPVQIYYNNTEEYSASEQNYTIGTITLNDFRRIDIEYTAQNSSEYFSSGEITSPGQNVIGIDAIYTQESSSARTDRITTVGIKLQNNKFEYYNPKTTNIRLDKTNNTIETTMTDVRHIHVRRITGYYEDEIIS